MIQRNFFRSERFEIFENKTNCVYSSVRVPNVVEQNEFVKIWGNGHDDIVKEGGKIGVSVICDAIYIERDEHDLLEIMHHIKEKDADLNHLEIRISNIKMGMHSPEIGFVTTNLEFVIKFTLDKNEKKINTWKCKKGSVL
jgi:virulence-associated protein VapD